MNLFNGRVDSSEVEVEVEALDFLVVRPVVLLAVAEAVIVPMVVMVVVPVVLRGFETCAPCALLRLH